MEWPSSLSLCPQGASILRMLRDWITPDLFQKGCQVWVAPKHSRKASSGGNNKAFVQKVNARGSLSVAEICNSLQYWVDNAKGALHTPTEWERELQEDLTAHQWGPKSMTADNREISSTPLFVLLSARIPSLSCKACLKLIWPQSCNPPKPNMQGDSCRWRIIQALRPDGAPYPREQN